ncbi:hypothetical protein CPSG_01105 [Coccidioides posadasii str. Silveira]|uniref:Uncharacterized protein n=1 Tax=Coccidioides posadasii (strain RMSCC 757 / Silveira) TaxID=443226 RepID=E9CR74_COCPS|nr:hypothetical protein CPSG_01105 [Coccidioides posadasii str. Silveira]
MLRRCMSSWAGRRSPGHPADSAPRRSIYSNQERQVRYFQNDPRVGTEHARVVHYRYSDGRNERYLVLTWGRAREQRREGERNRQVGKALGCPIREWRGGCVCLETPSDRAGSSPQRPWVVVVVVVVVVAVVAVWLW